MKKTFFTLIELLVTIAVIAILASLLLPALNKAKDSGKRVVCSNNLNQLGTVLFSYSGDYSNTVPCAWDNMYIWPRILDYKLEYLKKPKMTAPDYYKEQAAVYYCPSQINKKESGYYGDYGANDCVMWVIGRNGYSEIKCRLGKIRQPSQIMLLGESGHYRISAVETGSLYDPLYPHSGKINLLYCDGHVAASKKFISTVKTEAPWTTSDNW